MNSKFLLIISFVVLFGASACSTTETLPDEQQPEAAATPETAAAGSQAATANQDEKVPSQAKSVEDSAAAETSEPIVMVQPLPEAAAIPEAEAMPADVSPEVQPAPVVVEADVVEADVAKAEPEVIAKIEKPASVVPPVPAIDFEKKGANEFIITVAKKDATHPSFGKGHHLGFLLDNVQGKPVVLRRGELYKFDVRTDPLHDVYFSTSPVGWGGGVVIGDEIKGQFTYKGVIDITPSEKTPDVIYYQCRNHSTMGGKLFVVNKNTSQSEADKLLASVKSGKPSTAKTVKVSPAKVKQKLTFADMMLMSAGTKRVMASDNAEAKAMLDSAKQKIGAARQNLDAGKNESALLLADEGLRLVGSASRLVPSEEVLQEQNERYLELVDAVKNFEQSHKITTKSVTKSHGEKSVVDYDKKQVNALLTEAKGFADKRQYMKAIPQVEKAELIVTSAINMMLDSKTLVYDVKFDTAEDEYAYELRRFTSYEELVPVAIERKRPAPGAVKLMDGFVKKGRSQRADAIKKAEEGDYPTAIAMMLSATTQVRRALRIAGVQ